jgi:hypothetical protein
MNPVSMLEKSSPSSRPCGRLFPVLLTLSGMVVLYVFGHPMYETNDDMLMVGMLSGQMGQPAHADAVFLSVPLSVLLYALYRLPVHVPWYSLTLYAAQGIGCVLAYRMIFSLAKGAAHKFWLGLLFFSLYSFLFLRLNFASSSLFLWCMTCLYLAYLNLTGVPPGWRSLGPGCFLAFSDWIRPDIILVGICYTFPLALTFLLPRAKKRFLYVAVPLLLAVLLSGCFGAVMRQGTGEQQYLAFNAVRSDFMDTAKGDFHTGSEEALRQAGWSLDDYRMAKLLWIHDEDIYNAETFQTFLQKNAAPLFSVISLENGMSAFKNTAGYLSLLLCGLVMIFTGKTAVLPLPPGKESAIRKLSVLSLLVILLGMAVLACIRFPNRVALPLYLNLFGLFVLVRSIGLPGGKGLPAKGFFLAASLLALGLSFYQWEGLRQQAEDRVLNKKYFEESIQELQRAYPKPLFAHLRINWVADTANPFKEFADVATYRMIPASWTIRSPFYYDSLHRLGFSSGKQMVLASVNNDSFFYIFFESGDYFRFSSFSTYFQNHLNAHYGEFFPHQRLIVEPVLQKTYQDREGHPLGWVFFRVKTEGNLSGKS